VTKLYLIVAATVLASTTALLGSTPAGAQEIVVVSAPFERVGYADLDLSSSAGTARLEARIRRAAENVCIENYVKPIATAQLERNCFEAAVADGLSQAEPLIGAARAGRVLASANIIVRAK